MHELSIARNIVDIIQPYASAARGPVRVVRVRVGDLAGVVPDSLAFCFEAIIKGTSLEGARIEVVPVPVSGRCSACNASFDVQDQAYVCLSCGSPNVVLTGGRELEVTEIETD